MTSRELPDFDTLMALAKDDPQSLEQLRDTLTQQLIDAAPAALQPRLRGLQFQIDAKRQLAANPTAACLSISRMMHESFSRLHVALNTPPSQKSEDSARKARVIPFNAPVVLA